MTVRTLFSEAVAFFAYDNLRADGFMVRWSRLDMLSTCSTIVLLCWTMELLFAVAYYVPNRTRLAAIAFFVAYLAINVQV